MRVSVDTNECIGSGQCVLLAPDVFALDEDDDFARVVNPEPPGELAPAVREAEACCPSQAILVLDD